MQFVRTAVQEECSGFTAQTEQGDFQAELHITTAKTEYF
jgi:hypothetical protein